jgi:hypothetical protein
VGDYLGDSFFLFQIFIIFAVADEKNTLMIFQRYDYLLEI